MFQRVDCKTGKRVFCGTEVYCRCNAIEEFPHPALALNRETQAEALRLRISLASTFCSQQTFAHGLLPLLDLLRQLDHARLEKLDSLCGVLWRKLSAKTDHCSGDKVLDHHGMASVG